MPFYHTLGNIPHKRHTIFKNGADRFYYEQLFGTVGFDGMSTLLYHVHRPTQVKEIVSATDVTPKVAIEKNLRCMRLTGFNVAPEDDHLKARKTLLFNSDVSMMLAAPKALKVDYFYKNADCDELIFIHKGSGKLRSMVGTLDFKYGDYLVIPRGMIYKLEFDTADIRRPKDLETHDEKGDFRVLVKKQNTIHEFIYATHPFDVVGWDGYNYPYALSIHDFEPITGRVHQPPPVHQTFETSAFVVCSFCPRLYDYHPEAIPAPYNHSNIDSDEILYYVDGDFMSRNDINAGDITLHVAGIPHGPQPGAMERSIGKTKTDELAVMLDTFKPLMVTEEAMRIDDGKYWKSWLE